MGNIHWTNVVSKRKIFSNKTGKWKMLWLSFRLSGSFTWKSFVPCDCGDHESLWSFDILNGKEHNLKIISKELWPLARHETKAAKRAQNLWMKTQKLFSWSLNFIPRAIATHTKENENFYPKNIMKTSIFAEWKLWKIISMSANCSEDYCKWIFGGRKKTPNAVRAFRTAHYPWHWKSLALLCVCKCKKKRKNGHIRPEFFLPARSEFRRETIFW